MPIYDDEDSVLTVTFPGGGTLNLTKRVGFGSTETLRKFQKNQRIAQAAADRKRLLEGKVEAAKEVDELKALQEKIEAEAEVADETVAFVQFIFDSCSDWDNYATKADEAAGNRKPFTQENIAKIHLSRLKLIGDALFKEMTKGVDGEAIDPKDLSAESAPLSSSALKVQ
jgi:hypothetical protein